MAVSVGDFSLMVKDRSVPRSCNNKQRKGGGMMIRLGWGCRDINRYFYENKSPRIAALNQVFGDAELTMVEMNTPSDWPGGRNAPWKICFRLSIKLWQRKQGGCPSRSPVHRTEPPAGRKGSF